MRTRPNGVRLHSHSIGGAALSLAGFVASTVPAAGQVIASERASFTQEISGTTISADFGRPSARGRTALFGSQVPWGEVWTPGANLNTILRFSEAVTLGGQEVPAGSYGVWIRVTRDEPWRLMLHPDTTLFHTVHPPLSEAVVTVEMDRVSGQPFVETLRIELQDLRSAGARLDVAWGGERASVALEVDPGYVLTLPAEEAERYVGGWTLDETAMAPPDSVVSSILAGLPDEERWAFEAWLETTARPQEVELVHRNGRLQLVHPARDAIVEEMEGPGFETVLMPLADGIFEPGTLFRDDLALAGGQGVWEFEFDDRGCAVRFVVRNPGDEVVGTGTRNGMACGA